MSSKNMGKTMPDHYLWNDGSACSYPRRRAGDAYPHADGDRIAKAVPMELGITIDRAVEISQPLRREMEADETIAQLIATARKLEGCRGMPARTLLQW